jgi:hypothetical protein
MIGLRSDPSEPWIAASLRETAIQWRAIVGESRRWSTRLSRQIKRTL